MGVLFLVSGSVRSFQENLRRYPDCDIAVCASLRDEDTYFNPTNLSFLLEDPRVKLLLLEDPPIVPPEFTQERHRNAYKQWYRLHRLLECVPRTYDLYVRIRPDVCLADASQLPRESSPSLRIPLGHEHTGLNDSLAIGTYDQLVAYCAALCPTGSRVLSCPVERIPVDYRLVLSHAKVIAIAGDSGSGKSTLCRLIRPLFLFDKVLEYETDRYHKWERTDSHWNTTTHLHPDANRLEALEDDTFALKVGKTILSVDYDHTTGTFTAPTPVEPKETILLCGLHTLYTDRLRDLSDFKIYLDTSEHVKIDWKLARDTTVRKQSREEVLAKIASRKSDYETYIAPQKEHADLIIERPDQTTLALTVRGESRQVYADPTVDVRSALKAFCEAVGLPPLEGEPGFDGVVQFTIVRCLYGNGRVPSSLQSLQS
jgi:uridine kinase